MTLPARAQTAPPLPVFQHVDANGVDLTDGSFNFSLVEGSIGTGEGTLAVARSYGRSGWTDGLPGRLSRSLFPTNKRIAVAFGSRVEYFDLDASGAWVPQKRDGATLSGSGSSYTYTSADGTIVQYGAPGRSGFATYSDGGGTPYCTNDENGTCELMPLSVTQPNGRRLDLHWTVAEICGEANLETGQPCRWFPRLVGLANESRFLAKLRYATNSYTNAGPSPDWFRRTSALLVNTAVEACDPDAIDCTGLTQSWPTITYSQPTAGVTEITDIGGRTWRFAESAGSFAIRRPGSNADNVTVTRNATTGAVSQVIADGVTTNYARSLDGTTTTVTAALGRRTVIVSDLAIGRPVSVTENVSVTAPFSEANPLTRTTSFAYDAYGRLTRTTAPEGNYVEQTYDARGNVTQTLAAPKPSIGGPSIVTAAAFSATCTNGIVCNRPTSTTDARGNVTDYSYDAVHGGVLTVTAPAAASGGVRPQARQSYAQLTGAQGQSVYAPLAGSACQTQASCTGAADEVRTTIAYNGTNLQPVSATSGSGNNALTATDTFGYDRFGNMTSVDGPYSGTGDRTRFRYDGARQRIATISPDPDGTGALPHLVQRATYREDGQISSAAAGSIANPDGDLATMTIAQRTDTGFDAHGRPISQTQRDSAGTAVAVSHVGYDALGRPECSAQRLDSADWGAGAVNACSQDPTPSAAFGPDRISKTVRDAAGQVTEIRTAVGTALEAPEVRTEYSLNGRAAAVRDGENNRTTYEYDGLDRPLRTRFPVATAGQNASSATDYEELTYETHASGTRTSASSSRGGCATRLWWAFRTTRWGA